MSKRVLVVEDNELNLKLFCDLLRAHDYATEPVRDGREAVERARVFAPDLIVMDIQLPHVSGLELIEMCKADAELSAIPIMAVTAYAGKEDEERVRAAGAEAYVSKPISLMRFIGEVVALTPKGAAPAEEPSPADDTSAETMAAGAPAEETEPTESAMAAAPVIEDLFPESSPTEAMPAEDLFPEDLPQEPSAEVAAAEDPLPEDEPGMAEPGESQEARGESGDSEGEAESAVPAEEATPTPIEPPASATDDEKPI